MRSTVVLLITRCFMNKKVPHFFLLFKFFFKLGLSSLRIELVLSSDLTEEQDCQYIFANGPTFSLLSHYFLTLSLSFRDLQ